MRRIVHLAFSLQAAIALSACSDDPGTTPVGDDNHPPRVDQVSASPSVNVLPGEVIDLNIAVSDPDGDPVTLTWSAVAGLFSDPAAPSTSFTAPDRLGPLELRVDLEDSRGGRADFTFVAVVGYQEISDGDADGLTWADGDCNDLDASIHPGALEQVDGKDNDCNGFVDEGSFVADDDGDRWSELDGDCDDADPAVFPTNPEKADDKDNDCDGFVDEDTVVSDDDGDGLSESQGDCNDYRPDVQPGGLEVADGQDNDCDGSTDEGTLLGDDDGDGFSEATGDCDDSSPTIYPAAIEITDSHDNDCDGRIDEGSPGVDDDGDGFSEDAGDCQDEDAAIYPSAAELANGDDDDCDGLIDEGTVRGDDDGDGWAEVEGDCDDAEPSVYGGAPELADGRDNDCDGLIDEGTDAYDNDGDGVSVAEGDCDDLSAMTYPGAEEAADGLDNDCDATVDEGTVRYDDDGDDYTELEGDCDDSDTTVYPGAAEIPDGRDNNCDGIGDPNQPPVAIAQASSPEVTCAEAILDASGSYDPDGDALRYYYWFVVDVPEGSLVDDTWLLKATSSQASLVTDVEGAYTVGLIVSDGVTSSEVSQTSFTVSDRGYNHDPVAEAGADVVKSQAVKCSYNGKDFICPACQPLLATLDGRGSSDPDSDRLFYGWTVLTSTASNYALKSPTTAMPEIEVAAPPAEYGRSNTYAVILKLEVRDCQSQRDVDTVLVSYTCTGQ